MPRSEDERWMRLAVEQAAHGFPAPNPRVGCCIVQNGRLVGLGSHLAAGQPHAEVNALSEAGALSHGATAYVTLEPCNHHGRTPPCTEALLKAGVARVVIGAPDPNPRAAGGAERLREAGLVVDSGVLESDCEAANPTFLHAMRHKRPYIILKLAMSLDGKVAAREGTRTDLTGEEARTWTHQLRAEMGAVLIGASTAVIDDPLLTSRIPEVVNQPSRYVIDPNRRVPHDARLFKGPGRAFRLVDSAAAEDFEIHAPELSPKSVAGALFANGEIGVLVEGGPRTTASFLQDATFDELIVLIAPCTLGDGTPAFLGGQETKLNLMETFRLGADVALRYRRT
ncbi:MAG: Riboflavin biosynthesis protein RibD [Fimbriimonadaceae bacterium]|nr:Riboflavin biosynthesis protein RibD [Fimbriimonadaceae bacterium]